MGASSQDRPKLHSPRRGSARHAAAAAMVLALAGAAALSHPAAAAPKKAGTVFRDCKVDCPEMVVVPPGSFRMGADAGEEGRPEGHVHAVTIPRAFAVGTREVSNAEFERFLVETRREPTYGCRSYNPASGGVDPNPINSVRRPGRGAGEGAPQMPAVCVSWTDAKAYTQWLSRKTGQRYRLLTEAEWEYAARAGSQDEFPWGNDINTGCDQANIYDADGTKAGMMAVFGGAGGSAAPLPAATCSDGHAGAAPVGSYKPNRFGLYDMVGNVWEWVQDCYVAPYAANVPTNGRAYEVEGPCPRRAVRGGSWMSVPFRNRLSWRGRDPEGLVTWIFGFRVARDLPQGRAR